MACDGEPIIITSDGSGDEKRGLSLAGGEILNSDRNNFFMPRVNPPPSLALQIDQSGGLAAFHPSRPLSQVAAENTILGGTGGGKHACTIRLAALVFLYFFHTTTGTPTLPYVKSEDLPCQ